MVQAVVYFVPMVWVSKYGSMSYGVDLSSALQMTELASNGKKKEEFLE